MKLSNRYCSPSDLFSEFDHFFSRALHSPLLSRSREDGRVGIYEADQAWFLRTDLPGFAKDHVTLRFEDRVLHLAAKRDEEETAFRSSIERTFRTPDNIDPAGISAKLEDGVLEVTLPKVTPDVPESLEIEIK